MTARTPSIAVITLVSGRREHLVNQHAGLHDSTVEADHYIVVAMNDPEVLLWAPASAPHPLIAPIERAGALPLAAARNLGARRAIDLGADLLIFLDVDCVPSPVLLDRYATALAAYPEAILCGAVGYLPAGAHVHDSGSREKVAHFHPFRPRLTAPANNSAATVAAADPLLFWSLSFALAASTWQQVGGFHEKYTGYGGEDTDFAQTAIARGVPLLWVGGAEAFHQYHPTEDPPVHHVDDIIRNATIFAGRWGFWPMSGWLESFEKRGLAYREPESGVWRRSTVSA